MEQEILDEVTRFVRGYVFDDLREAEEAMYRGEDNGDILNAAECNAYNATQQVFGWQLHNELGEYFDAAWAAVMGEVFGK